MDILDALRQSQDGNAIPNLARAFGISPAEADAVLQSVVPQLARRIERNTLSRGGIADVVGAMGRAAERNYLDDAQVFSGTTMRDDGVAILDQILWSKDQSRAVAQRAAQSSGISEALIKQMLPAIAAMLMGGLAKAAAGGLSDILGRIPGLPGSPSASAGGPPPGPDAEAHGRRGDWSGTRPTPLPGGQAGAQIELGDQGPLPLPGNYRPGGGGRGYRQGAEEIPSRTPGENPYGDLSDIIRRGGTPAPGTGGGTLSSMIRGILGSILGFQSRGVLGWILRFVVLRYGMSIVRWFFSRLLSGRRI